MKTVAIVLILSIVALATASCSGIDPASTVASTTQREAIKDVRYVDDAANVIDGPSKQELEATLAALKKRKKIDFSVVTVVSTAGQSAYDYSLALARERKSNSNDKTVVAGLLLLVAVSDRDWHIQISRNLEVDLTHEILTKLSEPMTDSFRQKRYGEGVIKYVNAIVAKLEQIDFSKKPVASPATQAFNSSCEARVSPCRSFRSATT